MFGYNKFKAEMINELMAAGTTTTVYRVGDFVDLCRGPHIPTCVDISNTPSDFSRHVALVWWSHVPPA